MVKRDMPSPLGHALAGVVAAWGADVLPGDRAWRAAPASASFFTRAGGTVTLLCAAVAAMPDLDLLFHAHRSVSHSLTAVAVVTIVAAGVTGWVTTRHAWRIALMCGAAYATHLALDLVAVDRLAPRGLQALWPFVHRWYIAPVAIFPETQRTDLFSREAIRKNAIAAAAEIGILAPVLLGLWRVRIKALARLASQMTGRDQPS
jgi:hypothetical protein